MRIERRTDEEIQKLLEEAVKLRLEGKTVDEITRITRISGVKLCREFKDKNIPKPNLFRKWVRKDLTGQTFDRLFVIETTKAYGSCVCRCVCGNTIKTESYKLIKGTRTSCGCKTLEYLNRTHKNPFTCVYTAYKVDAKRRNINFNLTLEECSKMFADNCFYCNTEPSSEKVVSRTKETYIKYTGIDRINSKIGYEVNNCVPCCHSCNMAKWNKGFDWFFKWADNFVKNFSKERCLEKISQSQEI